MLSILLYLVVNAGLSQTLLDWRSNIILAYVIVVNLIVMTQIFFYSSCDYTSGCNYFYFCLDCVSGHFAAYTRLVSF